MRLFPNTTFLRDVKRMQDELSRFLDTSTTTYNNSVYPAVNLYQNQDNLILTSELPGIEANDLDINITNNSLKISGTLQEVKYADNTSTLRVERPRGKFSRTIELPYEVEAERVEANLVNGVLTITLPIHEKEKPKQIKIKANQ